MSDTDLSSTVGLLTKTETCKLNQAVGVGKVPDPCGTSDECLSYRTSTAA